MTELEQCLYDWLLKDTGVKNKICAKARAAKLLRLARKQIASEIDNTEDIQKMSAMFPNEYQSMFIGYVEDIIKKIKEG